MEKFFNKSATQIGAAAFLAIMSGVAIGYFTHRGDPSAYDDVAPTADRYSIVANSITPPPVAAAAPSVSETLPTEPDSELASLPGTANEKSGKFARAVPEKSPGRIYEPRTLPGRAPTPADNQQPHAKNNARTHNHAENLAKNGNKVC